MTALIKEATRIELKLTVRWNSMDTPFQALEMGSDRGS